MLVILIILISILFLKISIFRIILIFFILFFFNWFIFIIPIILIFSQFNLPVFLISRVILVFAAFNLYNLKINILRHYIRKRNIILFLYLSKLLLFLYFWWLNTIKIVIGKLNKILFIYYPLYIFERSFRGKIYLLCRFFLSLPKGSPWVPFLGQDRCPKLKNLIFKIFDFLLLIELRQDPGTINLFYVGSTRYKMHSTIFFFKFEGFESGFCTGIMTLKNIFPKFLGDLVPVL